TGTAQSVTVSAPLPGVVLRLSVSPGDRVGEGDTLLIIESMKMENPVVAPASGIVEEITVAAGDQVAADQPVARIGS
ncbi:MAG: acetyl-CoA carboxylase biotin carboxyl carrier protein subunit, partial [Spirochaetaceae bacterium]